MKEIDKLDGMVKTKKCGYEFIGGCKDLRTAKQKLEKIEELCKELISENEEYVSINQVLQIIRGEE